MIVADTNLIAYLLLPGERTDAAEAVYRADPAWAAPLLWRSGLRNVVARYEREGSLALEAGLAVVADAEWLMDGREYSVPSEAVLRLASECGLSAYDSEFVVLARELGVPLVTADVRMRDAAPDVAVAPDGFV